MTTRSYMKYLVTTILANGSLILTASEGQTAPVPFGNNHYEFIEVVAPFTGSNNSWSAASAAAAARVFNGVNGHLATVSTQAENVFLLSLTAGRFTTFTGAWLGGRAPQGWLEGPESGQPFTYTNWAGSEPNNAGYAYMIIGSSSPALGSGQWADDSGVQGVPDPTNDPVVGYFVEYEEAAVPAQGSTWSRIKAVLR